MALRFYLVAAVAVATWGWGEVRTDLLVADAVDGRLEQLGSMMGGEWTYDSLEPAGVSGVELRGLRFSGETRDLTIGVERAVVFPDVGGLLGRRVEIGAVQLHGLTLDGVLPGGATGFSPTDAPGSARANHCRLMSMLPGTVHIDGGRIGLRSAAIPVPLPEVTLGSMDVELGCDVVPQIALSGVAQFDGHRGRFEMSHDGRTTPTADIQFDSPFVLTSYVQSLPGDFEGLLSDQAAITVGGVHVSGRDHMQLRDVDARRLNTPVPQSDRWRVDRLFASTLQFSRGPEHIELSAHGALVELDGLVEEVLLPVESARVWADHRFSAPDGELVLGGGPHGTLALDVSRSAYTGDLSLTGRADEYDISELVKLIPARERVDVRGGRMTGELALTFGPDSEYAYISLDGGIADGDVIIPLVAPRPLTGIDLTTSIEFVVDRVGQSVEWEPTVLALGEIDIHTSGRFQWLPGSETLDAHVAVANADAAALHRALPVGLAPALEGTEFGGNLSVEVSLALDLADPERSNAELAVDVDDVEVVRFGPGARVDQLTGPFAIRVVGRDDVERLVGPLAEAWVPRGVTGSYLVSALVNAEDGRFWRHNGFDERAILASLEDNVRQRRIVRGGSTISQQLARTLFLGPERTLGRKLEEAIVTWQLEQHLTKERIVELYVNAVHWGPGVHGIGEAAEAYFGKAPAELDLLESAFLASILSHPNRFGSEYAVGHLSPSRAGKICNVLANMQRRELISEGAAAASCRAARRGQISDSPRPEDLADPAYLVGEALSARLE